MRSLILSSALLVGLFVVSPAKAQDAAPSSDNIKQAAAAYDLGRERFRDGQYIEAAEKFETADDYAPSPAAIRLAIFARKEAGHVDRALTLAALALSRHPEDTKLAEEAQAVIDEFAPQFARVDVSCDEPCELLLDNRIVHGAAATTRVVYVPPGGPTLRASWSEGRVQSETLQVEAGASESISFVAPEIPEEPVTEEPQPVTGEAQPAEEKKGWHPAIFWTGAGLTVAGAGASVGLWIRAKNNPGEEAVIANCSPGETTCEEYRQGVRNQNLAYGVMGATAAIGVFTLTSAFLTDWGGGEDKVAIKKGDLTIRPSFAFGRGVSLGATGSF